MCGIAGIYQFNNEPVKPKDIKKMCQLMIHRGPDDEGILTQNNVGLGHRRLSIIDLSSAGHQPMTNEIGNIWLVHNGEIYNYLDLTK